MMVLGWVVGKCAATLFDAGAIAKGYSLPARVAIALGVTVEYAAILVVLYFAGAFSSFLS